MKVVFAILLAALCVTAEANDAAFVATHYADELSLDFAQQSIAAEETITLRAQRDAPVAELDAGELNVAGVWDGDLALGFAQDGSTLRVTFPRAATTGETRTIRIRYSGKPRKGLRFAGEQAFTAFHTSYWMVCQNDPAVKASLELGVIVPAGLEAISGGIPEGPATLAGGRTRYRYRLDRPYPAYLFGFVAGHFNEATAQAGRVTLRFLSPTLSAEQMRVIFRETPEILATFEEAAGVPFPGATYTQVLMPNAPPQEMAEMSLMSDRYGQSVLDDPREDYLIAHELAHQWWGNLVTCRTWSDFWLNEAMATFMVALFKEYHWGRDEYDREMSMARLRYENAPQKVKDRPLVFTGWTKAEEMSGPVTYSKGALVLHLLRTSLGDEAFRSGLRAFTRAGAGGMVVSDDLRRAMEASSGLDLKRFFDQWVYAPPPRLIAVHRAGPDAVAVDIEQKQPETWTLIVPIAVTTSTLRVTRQVRVTRRRQRIRIAVDGPVLSVSIDPGGTLPDSIAHQRPMSMLVYQLAVDPLLNVRAGAIRALEESCARPSPCAEQTAALQHAAAMDASRLLRRLATEALGRLQTAVTAH